MSGGGGGAFGKITGGAKDLFNSVKENPTTLLTAGLNTGVSSVLATKDLGTRVRDDQREQAAGMAEKEQARAQAEIDRAKALQPKDIDALALERRRRALAAGPGGRAGSILTGGQSLGSADVATKALLGL